jgi:Protein of unknown function (DUF997)
MTVRREDPVLTSSRREAWLVFLIWLVACVYSIGVCYRFGYNRDAATLTYVLGFPDWIFWGVVMPWTICTLLCFVMAYFVITDDDLGEAREEEALTHSCAEPKQGAEHA